MISPIPVMVLAAGPGTRLLPLSSWRAKALMPVGDRPALAHVVDRVEGVARVVVVNAHHRAEEVEAFAGAMSVAGAAIHVSRETELLGTAGGLRRAGSLLGAGDVLVWNSDMVGPLDASALVTAHARARAGGALATLAVRPPAPGTRGNVGLDEDGRVVRLRGEVAVTKGKREVRSADFVGVHVVGEELRSALPPAGCLVGDVYLPALREEATLASIAIDAEMIDIGTPREYLRANLRWLAERNEPSWRGAGARVAPTVTLDRVVVGQEATVVGAGEIESCVVWPGAEAVAPLAGAIVTPQGVVSARG